MLCALCTVLCAVQGQYHLGLNEEQGRRHQCALFATRGRSPSLSLTLPLSHAHTHTQSLTLCHSLSCAQLTNDDDEDLEPAPTPTAGEGAGGAAGGGAGSPKEGEGAEASEAAGGTGGVGGVGEEKGDGTDEGAGEAGGGDEADPEGRLSQADQHMISSFDFNAWRSGAGPDDLAGNAGGTDENEAEYMWSEVKKLLDSGGDKQEGVKVAVRCRPFNSREKSMDAKLIVDMEDGRKIMLQNPTKPDDVFDKDFDFAFWSHEPGEEGFVGQADVFTSMGAPLLANVWQGFNVGIFACEYPLSILCPLLTSLSSLGHLTSCCATAAAPPSLSLSFC